MGPIMTGCFPKEFMSSKWRYVVTVTSKSPRLKVGSTLRTVHGLFVQNRSMSSSDQLYAKMVIGSGALLTILTNESWGLPPSLSLHISITENNGSFFCYNIAPCHHLGVFGYQPLPARYEGVHQHLMQFVNLQFVKSKQRTSG